MLSVVRVHLLPLLMLTYFSLLLPKLARRARSLSSHHGLASERIPGRIHKRISRCQSDPPSPTEREMGQIVPKHDTQGPKLVSVVLFVVEGGGLTVWSGPSCVVAVTRKTMDKTDCFFLILQPGSGMPLEPVQSITSREAVIMSLSETRTRRTMCTSCASFRLNDYFSGTLGTAGSRCVSFWTCPSPTWMSRA